MEKEISAKLAQDIVMDMKKIINQNINFITTNGIILASTDPNRVGCFHGGGKKVGHTKRKLTIRYDDEFTGTLKGINLPIYFEHEILGVLGITGEEKEVEKYGEIIKRMTELIIKDTYSTFLKNKELENQRLIIEELLFYGEKDHNELSKSVNVFNIKNNIPRTVIVAEIIEKDTMFFHNTERIWNVMDTIINKETKHLMMWNRNGFILILQNISLKKIRELLIDIIKRINNEFEVNIKFGIGTIEEDISNIKKSYEKARLALRFSLSQKKKNFIFYEEMDLELLAMSIEKEVSIGFQKKVLGNLNSTELAEFSEIAQLFEEYNGSITKISEKLFIHKNTLQYKLNKVFQKTGYNPRDFKDFVTLKMALLFININKPV